jgi:hypothetical protein
MIGRDSIFGSFAALADPTVLNSAMVLIPGVASTLDIDRLRAAADQSATLRAALVRHGLAVRANSASCRMQCLAHRGIPACRDACYRLGIYPAVTDWF